jgi:NAD+ synthase (glutamine-hydrolysing)
MAVEAADNNAELIVFPELSLTGYTCGDLFLQESLLEDAKNQLLWIAEKTSRLNAVILVGTPLCLTGKLYNCAAAIHKGLVKGIVPKTFLPNYAEFYEQRHFISPSESWGIDSINLVYQVPFGTDLLFSLNGNPDFTLAIELCEDLWAPIPPSSRHCLAGATIVANLSASNEMTGKDDYRRALVANQSARTICAYVYSCSGDGESTTDLVFSGHNIISENGRILSESPRFLNKAIYADIDLSYLIGERRRNTTFRPDPKGYRLISLQAQEKSKLPSNLIRPLSTAPFVPADPAQREKRCEEIIMMQALGLKTRISHVNAQNVVIGISGGLDSTLALIVAAKAFDLLNLTRKGIHCITMPCFGTTERTKANALTLISALGATLREIPLAEAVTLHFRDIGHSDTVHDLTYENSQARERTQVLMDVASQVKGFVVGTGDLSELALGFATYNGDHMSMYGVNSSIPKTLIRYLIAYAADSSNSKTLHDVLYQILETPVSPELLPPKEGDISQETEKILGPYEVHDFFLYYMMRLGHAPEKLLYLAKMAFKGRYEDGEITSWLKVFYKRFFSNQFKRSCLPDGPKVGSVALSPRGDWRMPSDASVAGWLARIEN